ncbi:putative inositol-3,4-bisphosphate 4-phosphatase [Phytophthora cinnamomi]|uniref:putative inositol-3,4-bisphosphate 4-phosphatase n=1 Tax=Phytophthora cinnamomi TaxID=4785 RepID=UPI003559F79E|nr:putative inositol-3,4-bisphosphate 4-phosphatase [Phytophthora cinnamomi]
MRRRLLRGGGRLMHVAALLLLLLASAAALPAREEAEALDPVPAVAALERHVIELEFEHMTKVARGDVADDGRTPVIQQDSQQLEFPPHVFDGQTGSGSAECSGSAEDAQTVEQDCSQASVSGAASASGATENGGVVVDDTLGSNGLEAAVGSAGVAQGSAGVGVAVGSGSTGQGVSVGSGGLDATVGSGCVGGSVGSGSVEVEAYVGSGGLDATVGSGCVGGSVGSGSAEMEAYVGSGGLDATVGSHGLDVSVGSHDLDASVGSGGVDATVGSGEIDATVGSRGIHLDATVGSDDIDATFGSRGIHVKTSSRNIDATVGRGGVHLGGASSSNIDASVGSHSIHMDVDTLVGSHGVEVATTTHSPGVNAHVDPITTQIPTSSSDGFDGVQVAVGSADDSTSGAKTASSGYPEERSSILQGMSTPKVTSTEETPSPATSSGLTTITEATLSPATGSNFTASSEATAVSTEAPSLTNSTTPGSHNGSEEVVKVLSLTASNSSSSESESGSEGWRSGSADYVPYTSTYCRCKPTECQNEYPGGNPFLNLYADPGETNLNIESDNSTYFCVTDLLPSGVKTNDSWEIRTTFTFQIQVTNVAWTGNEDQEDDYTSGFRLPPLSEVILMDDNDVMGSDCAQTLVHAKTYSKYTLSVYSVMSITFFAVALAGAILVTRMNGISFSRPTFYNDMTSLSVMMIFVLCIVGNAIWISVSTKASSASGTDIYYLLYAISVCFTWTMMTSVCFHWGTVLFHDVGPSGRLIVFIIYVIINVAFYGVQLFGVVSLTDFYKCTYDDYLKNPFYTMRLCSNDYCPDLQPTQWKYAVNNVCKDVSYSDWFFPLQQSAELLIFLTSVALLVLGTFVIQRGVRLIDQSGDIFDDHVVKVMKKSLITYLVVILSIALVLGTSCIMNSILHWKNWSINSVVWYVFSIWLPTLVPPIGFLLLQWNPRLHGMNWNPSLHVKDPQLLHRTMSSISDRVESGKFAVPLDATGLSDGWAGILRFPDTEYNPIGQESVDGTQNVLALAIQLVSPIPLTHACFVELYVAENTASEGGENDVTGDDYYEDLPMLSYRRSSISTFIETGLHQEGILSRRSHSLSLLGGGALPTPLPVSNPGAKWSRVGFTETVLPTLVTANSENGGGTVTQIATFLSVLQIPVMPANPLLRFVVYEIPEKASSPSSDGDLRESRQMMRASSRQLDERARIARVSGMGMAPPSRPKVFCEFSCACDDMLASDEVNLVARQVSCRNRSPIPTVLSDGTGTESPNVAAAMGTATPEVDPSVPRLRVKSMTVSPRQLKENSGFYITKSFQFAEGDEMVIEDMVESPLTNELPRQYLELLVAERADDLARAQADAAGFEARVKSGLVGNLYDNLIEQIQGENDQTVVQTWLNDRVQQRKMYVEALRECHQLCIDRAGEGLNFKASTEKKSLVLRFLPINLHVQDMWVGPTADLRSQRTRRTSPNVKVYPTVTVGAFAAHCFKFRHNGSILSLRATLQKRSLSRVQSDASERSSTEMVDWTNADVRSTDEMRWHLTTRFDMCLSQALTALVASFCRQLEYSLQHATDRTFLHTIDSIGFLFQVESLLSTQGKEIGMLEDFSAAVDALKHVTFVLDTSPPAHLPSTLLNLHMKNTPLPGVVSVRLSKGSTKGTFTVAVGVRCNEDIRASIPSTIRSGGPISVTPVIFTQGINEMQTLANNAGSKKTTLQDIINRKNFFVLTRYVEKYKQLAAQRPDAVPTPVSTIAPLVELLEGRIATASKRQVVKSKHPKIIQESSHLCRLLGAGRVTSCKSAKDRTGMSVTLEQVRLLSENHGLPEEFAVRTVSTMRSNGVRLENALKNTGKRQYAFNALQRSLLPDEYKCPEGTYGRGNVS